MIAGMCFPLILIAAFIIFTGGQAKSITGKWQFSPYGGWKLANNALYMYPHVQTELPQNLPARFNALDSSIRSFFKANEPKSLFEDDATAGSYFMFGRNSPLIAYMDAKYGKGAFVNSKKWYTVAPFYQSYGSLLIQKYPGSFLLYFVGPNLYRYFFPPAEILGGSNEYAIYENLDAPLLKDFFRLSSSGESDSIAGRHDYILYPSSVLFTLSHYFFVFCVIRFLLLGGFRKLPKPIWLCVCLAAGFWICDLGFSILSSAVVLRYQLFITTLEISFGIFLGQYTWQNLEYSKAEGRKGMTH
jgi:hypothetical protein